MAFYNVSFDIETDSDPGDWFWPRILEDIDTDGDRLIYSSLRLREVIL